MLLAYGVIVRAQQGPGHRGARRIEICFPLTASTDIAFGISLRVPRHRPRARHDVRRWMAVVMTAALYVFVAMAPAAIIAAGPALARLAALAVPSPAAPVYAYPLDDPARSIVHARSSMLTALSDEPPGFGIDHNSWHSIFDLTVSLVEAIEDEAEDKEVAKRATTLRDALRAFV